MQSKNKFKYFYSMDKVAKLDINEQTSVGTYQSERSY